jgi:hypothetical protein
MTTTVTTLWTLVSRSIARLRACSGYRFKQQKNSHDQSGLPCPVPQAFVTLYKIEI